MQKLKNFTLPTLPTFASSSSSATENTSPPLDPDTLTTLDARRTVLAALLASLTVYHSTAAKLRPDPQRSLGGSTETALPVQWVGREMLAGEEQLDSLDTAPEGFAAYGNAHSQARRRGATRGCAAESSPARHGRRLGPARARSDGTGFQGL
uniref:Uncharacterized protein n=1 Tax=Leucosporidium scottii TaxID=5278 RepID=A0A0H5FUY0_9BASI|nr:hypothetical protein [Leucosporidium scottii]